MEGEVEFDEGGELLPLGDGPSGEGVRRGDERVGAEEPLDVDAVDELDVAVEDVASEDREPARDEEDGKEV